MGCAPFRLPRIPLRGSCWAPARLPSRLSTMGTTPEPPASPPPATLARPFTCCAPGRGSEAGLGCSMGRGGGVLWKDRDELLLLGQPE